MVGPQSSGPVPTGASHEPTTERGRDPRRACGPGVGEHRPAVPEPVRAQADVPERRRRLPAVSPEVPDRVVDDVEADHRPVCGLDPAFLDAGGCADRALREGSAQR